MKKVIWTYWHQGIENAPDLVKTCVKSWQRHNPEYEFHILSESTLDPYIQVPKQLHLARKDFDLQKLSNFIRLELLAKYGGVWTDATVYCAAPLDQWLPDYFASGFFAFRNPGNDRLLSTWFLAANAENPLLIEWHQRYSSFFQHNSFSNQNTKLGHRFLKHFRSNCQKVHRTPFWNSWLARKILRVYPYYICHYLFNQIIGENPKCRRHWSDSQPYSSSMPHILQSISEETNGSQIAVAIINSKTIPVFKLNWRDEDRTSYWTTVGEHLKQHLPESRPIS